jgi:dUTP pyrophosphatase
MTLSREDIMTDCERTPVDIRIERCRESARLPGYARAGDAGMDLRAAVEMVIAPGQTVAVPTGIRVAIPVGYEIQIRPRSGLSLHTPLRIPNSPGTIDSGFRDEIQVILSNESRELRGEEMTQIHLLDTKGNCPGSYRVLAGDRIAQMVLARVETISWQAVESIHEEGGGEGRGGGFGHTGVK